MKEKIIRVVESVNNFFEPLSQIYEDETFKGEFIRALGGQLPKKAADMGRFQKALEKFKAIKEKVNSAAEKVGNLILLGKLLLELYGVGRAIYEMLDACDWGEDTEINGSNDPEADLKKARRNTAISNALLATTKLLAQTLLRNKAPRAAAIARTTGLAADELNTIRRAILLLLPFGGSWVETLKPIGLNEEKEDKMQQWVRAAFLDLSIVNHLWLNGLIKEFGEILLHFGYEASDSDNLPAAAKAADRILQMQFLPGDIFEKNKVLEELSDLMLSFATIPVFEQGTDPNADPIGYQYWMKFDLTASNLGSDDSSDPGIKLGKHFRFNVPKSLNTTINWGHGIDKDDILKDLDIDDENLLQLRFPDTDTDDETESEPQARSVRSTRERESAAPAESKEEEQADENFFKRGEIALSIVPKALMVGGQQRRDLEIRLDLRNFSLQFSGQGRDGFLKKLFPDRNASMKANVSLSYSIMEDKWKTEGLDGADGLFFQFKVKDLDLSKTKQTKDGEKKSSIAKLQIPCIYVGILPYFEPVETTNAQGAIEKKNELRGVIAETSVAMSLTLGDAFQLNFDRMGLEVVLAAARDNEPGNLGSANLAIGLKPPSGIGIMVNAKAISGGGFLKFDRQKGEYLGVAQLNIKNKVNLKAFGVLLTKLPGGAKGYSFVFMISTEFPPIQLGLGFWLTGVGGMVGLQRRVNRDRLVAALQTREFDDVLFPEAPLENPYGLLNTINGLFPVQEDQYFVAALGQFAWGPAQLVTIDLGLIVEWPNPIMLYIIGVLKADLDVKIGGKKTLLLHLQCNFLGIFDFDQRLISFDARLFESTLAGMKLEGDMALRVNYGSNPDFAITIGGFHPSLTPPALPLPADLRRLQLHVLTGNPSLIVSAYVAITPNSIQFGIAGVFKFEKWGVKILGELAFDAWIQFNPPSFEVGIHFLLAASWKGVDFAAIRLDGVFGGFYPGYIKGSLELKVWIFSKTVSLDTSWGDDSEEALESVRVQALIVEDLNTNPGNWEVAAGRTTNSITLARRSTTAQSDPGLLVLQPNELLTVRQNTVPLGIRIDKFGVRKPEGASKFTLRMLDKNGKPLLDKDNKDRPNPSVQNHFAPAQFIHLTDDQKLNVPSYERFDSGLTFEGLDDIDFGGFAVAQEVVYEIRILEPTSKKLGDKPQSLQENLNNFEKSLQNNAIANSSFGQRSRPQQPPILIRERFTVADKSSLNAYESTHAWSETEARQKLEEIERFKPRMAGKLVVLLED